MIFPQPENLAENRLWRRHRGEAAYQENYKKRQQYYLL